MKLSLEAVAEFNQIYSYDENAIVIRPKHQTGLETFQAGFLLLADQIIADRHIDISQSLADSDLMYLKQFEPELIIFITNTGLTLQSQRATMPLINNGIGVEIMMMGPACRTFNLLVSEQRQVLLVASF